MLKSAILSFISAPPDFRCDEPIAFSWYLIKVIAPLYKYDVAGGYVYKQGVSENYEILADFSMLDLGLGADFDNK